MQVECRNIQVGYGETVIINDMSLTLDKHQITSIIGPNGSGKSTVLKAITRLLNYQKGAISVDGRDLKAFTWTDALPKNAGRAYGQRLRSY